MSEQPPLPQLPPSDALFSDGRLISAQFDDIYFSVEDGLAETEFVFLHGSDLPQALATHQDIVIAETGFGTGLNLCAVIKLLYQTQSRSQIHYISFEANPLPREIAAQALRAFPQLNEITDEVLSQWPRRWPGVHHMRCAGGQLTLTLHYGQAEEILPTLDFKADIWFLDGFSPAKNSSLWSELILHHVGRCSYQGTKCASFTVARAVLDGLSSAGFVCEKRPGFGRKRNMLVAEMKAGSPKPALKSAEQVLIIGGGIAGCAVAHHLHNHGISHQIVEAGDRLAGAASGNPAGLVMPHLSVGDDLSARLSLSAFADTLSIIEKSDAILDRRILSLDIPELKKSRQQKLAAQNYPADLVRYYDHTQLQEHMGYDLGAGGMSFEDGLVIDPARYCHFLAADSPCHLNQHIEHLHFEAPYWQVHTDTGAVFSASHLVLAAGHHLPPLLQKIGFDNGRFQITSGQISLIPPQQMKRDLPALNFGGYLASTGEHLMLGASYSHQLSDTPSDEGHIHNFNLLPPSLREYLSSDPTQWQGRTAFRLATGFRMPVCDAEISSRHPQISVLGALGSRGLTHSSFLARYLAGQLNNSPSFLSRKLCDAMALSRVFGVNF